MRFPVVFAMAVLSAGLSFAARLDGPPSVDSKIERRHLLEHIRLAASDRLPERDDEIAAYLAAQFNTIVLYDNEDGLLKSEDRISFEVDFVRAHRLHVLLGKATETCERSQQTDRMRAVAQRARHPLTAAPSKPVSDDEIRDRLSLWDRYGHDLILGVFFLHDDAFLIHASVSRQRHLYALAHDAVADWAVFGMIGEFGFDATPEEVALHFDPNAFDHLIMLMYPLNIGDMTGVHLDIASSADPDEDMRRYVQRYLTHMGEKFLSRLTHGQLAMLVIQAFAYDGESIGHVPRPSDIMIQATVVEALLRAMPGQEQNHALAYFLWDGSRAGMFGLWQRPDWMTTAEQANRIDQLRESGVGLNP